MNSQKPLPQDDPAFLKQAALQIDQYVASFYRSKKLPVPAVDYYTRDRGMPLDNLSNTMRLFLGTRMECAQCHDAPFGTTERHDFYQLAAFTHGQTSVGQTSGRRRAHQDRRQRQTRHHPLRLTTLVECHPTP